MRSVNRHILCLLKECRFCGSSRNGINVLYKWTMSEQKWWWTTNCEMFSFALNVIYVQREMEHQKQFGFLVESVHNSTRVEPRKNFMRPPWFTKKNGFGFLASFGLPMLSRGTNAQKPVFSVQLYSVVSHQIKALFTIRQQNLTLVKTWIKLKTKILTRGNTTASHLLRHHFSHKILSTKILAFFFAEKKHAFWMMKTALDADVADLRANRLR